MDVFVHLNKQHFMNLIFGLNVMMHSTLNEKIHSMNEIQSLHKTVRCTSCNKLTEVTEGTVVFGASWFHGECWESAKVGGLTLDKFFQNSNNWS